MFMAEMARFIFPGSTFGVAHCNFGLRGEESDGDEAFVRRWCETKGIPFIVSYFDTRQYAAEKGLSLEMAARELRYRRFAEICREKGYDAVAVAHNAEDNAETFLLNLLRGTGTKGLRGMSEDCVIEGCRVLRPLLTTGRDAIRDWLKLTGKQWREDSTNGDTAIKRNRLRKSVLPAFSRINPSWLATLRRDMEHICQVDDIAEDFWKDALSNDLIIKEEPAPIVSIDLYLLNYLGHREYLLARALEPYGFSQGTLEALCRLLDEGGTISGKTFEAPLWRIETSAEKLWIRPRAEVLPEESLLIPAPGDYRLVGRLIRIETLPAEEISFYCEPGTGVFTDADALPFPFVIRHWHNGDWFRPLGMRGRKKLSDFFTGLKWSLTQKREALVVVAPGQDESRVAAVLGIRPDDKFKVKEKTKTILRITINQ